jgi:hypothetical protein
MGGSPSGWICVLDARSWTLQAGGKLTRALVATAAKVVAVEPVAGMRERLAAALTGVELLDAWPRRFHSRMPGFTPRRSGRRFTGSTAIGH